VEEQGGQCEGLASQKAIKIIRKTSCVYQLTDVEKGGMLGGVNMFKYMTVGVQRYSVQTIVDYGNVSTQIRNPLKMRRTTTTFHKNLFRSGSFSHKIYSANPAQLS
jgi:hypothetical protein